MTTSSADNKVSITVYAGGHTLEDLRLTSGTPFDVVKGKLTNAFKTAAKRGDVEDGELVNEFREVLRNDDVLDERYNNNKFDLLFSDSTKGACSSRLVDESQYANDASKDKYHIPRSKAKYRISNMCKNKLIKVVIGKDEERVQSAEYGGGFNGGPSGAGFEAHMKRAFEPAQRRAHEYTLYYESSVGVAEGEFVKWKVVGQTEWSTTPLAHHMQFAEHNQMVVFQPVNIPAHK